MPPLERFILHRLCELDEQVRAAYEGYDFKDVIRPLLDFCPSNCRPSTSTSARTPLLRPALAAPPRGLRAGDATSSSTAWLTWLAPILPFTMEEAWLDRHPDAVSVHLASSRRSPRTG